MLNKYGLEMNVEQPQGGTNNSKRMIASDQRVSGDEWP